MRIASHWKLFKLGRRSKSALCVKQLTPFWLLTIGRIEPAQLPGSVRAQRCPDSVGGRFQNCYGDSGRTSRPFMIGYFVTSPFFRLSRNSFFQKMAIAVGIFVWSLDSAYGFASGFACFCFFASW